MKRTIMLALIFSWVSAPNRSPGANEPDGPFKPTWESLSRHEEPEWFRDAKFGIYTHWGPISFVTTDAPSGMEWYARQMYQPNQPAFKYHRKTFGAQEVTGYKDIIPLFKAEKFDAAQWADLFARAGAKFAGPVAIHHDNFAMWDSKVTKWNSVRMGPHRDITGELEQAIRQRGMKFMTSFHHAFTWEYYEPAFDYDAADPQWADLYGPPHKHGAKPSRAFLDTWLAKVNEVNEKYRPDMIWFDFGLGKEIPPAYQRQMFADYYNLAETWGKEVCVDHKHRDIHEHTGILDFERGREDRLTPYPWLTDTSVGPWFYHQCLGLKSVNELVDVLVDIVSKNGCMLLNVGPAADGTIPGDERTILLGIGDWLKVNGEAIHRTRPWLTFGEGPTRNAGGGFSENKDRPYTGQDIRFTRSKDGQILYIVALGWPKRPLVVRSMQVDRTGPNAQVRLLGYEPLLSYRVNERSQMVIDVPELPVDRRPCGHAFSFKLTGFDVSLHPEARFYMPRAIRLAPEQATLEGTKMRLQDVGGRPNIGAWDSASERAHWLVWVRTAGVYAMRGEFSCAYGQSALKTTLAGQSRIVAIPKTDGWFKPVFVNFGEFKIDRPGVYQLTLEPAEATTWKAVNVWQLELAPMMEK